MSDVPRGGTEADRLRGEIERKAAACRTALEYIERAYDVLWDDAYDIPLIDQVAALKSEIERTLEKAERTLLTSWRRENMLPGKIPADA